MYARPTAPRSIGGVLDDAVRLYKEAFRAWLWPSAAVAVVTAGLGLVAGLLLGANPTPTQMLNFYKAPAIWGSYLAFGIVLTWAHFSLLAALQGVYTGGAPRARESFSTALKLLPTALLGAFLWLLGIALGWVLLVIPGIILFGRWQFWGPALIEQRGSATAALGRSAHLVKGYWWRASTIVFVAAIMVIVLSLLVSFVVALPTFVASARSVPAQVAIHLFSAAVSTFITPATPAAAIAAYYDLRLRKEGGDLATRVGSLQPA